MNGDFSGQAGESEGVIPLTFRDVFDHIEKQDSKYFVHVSYMEIYKEEIRDLLAPKVD
jgi:hypothetical protein